MLEVTARNENGENIFSTEETYEMVGFDGKGQRTYDSWLIRQINADKVIPAEGTRRESFVFTPPKGTESVTIDAVLSYQIAPAAQPVLMGRTSRKLSLNEK